MARNNAPKNGQKPEQTEVADDAAEIVTDEPAAEASAEQDVKAEAPAAEVEAPKAAKAAKVYKGDKAKYLAAGNILHGKKLFKKGEAFPHPTKELYQQGSIVEA